MSGRVETLSQFNEPTRVCIFSVSRFCITSSYSLVGMESMGYPPLYGCFGVLTASPSNLTVLHNSSIYAVWDNLIVTHEAVTI